MISKFIFTNRPLLCPAFAAFFLFSSWNSQADIPSGQLPIVGENVTTERSLDSEYANPHSRNYGAAVGVQVPTGLFGELIYRPFRKASFSLGAGGFGFGLPPYIAQNSAQVDTYLKIMAFEARSRLHVFDGAFFVGLAAGWQKISLEGLHNNVLATGDLSRFYLTPHLGWMWVLDSGLSLGFEAGVQLPLSSEVGSTGLASAHAGMLRSIVDPYQMTAIPYLNLIKIGYMF